MSKSLPLDEASAFLDSLLHTALGDRIFRIYTSFNVTVPSSWRIEERVLEEFHLLYVKSGCVIYQVSGVPLKLKAGSLLFLSDGAVHSAFRDQSEPLSIIPIRFKIGRYEDEQGPFHQTEAPCHFAFLPREPAKLRLLFESIHHCFSLPPSVRRDALCHAAVCQTLAEMSRQLEDLRQGVPIHPAILHIKNHIDSNPADRLSVQELAALSGLTPKYCSRLFQQLFGLSIKAYQIKARIEYAQYLLEHTDQSIIEISYHLGYPDPFSFSKQFKAVTGTAPSNTIQKRRSLKEP
ncbi:AraC family transcriptional regulator [Paenibacillus sp. J2TS4]|uniref:helix-turn-helix domain-containing protein n=1 Tax=Paenibacillus sp. J2TS4 TaxID=2807194 RepID=UPI001B0D7E81|nr:AraC family transcriptional regulator [Paenibacillus sp. J2TS4]GIP34010.1 hypothetical protein J2TS4_32200 [Paenibacillus sp. J2TS4]